MASVPERDMEVIWYHGDLYGNGGAMGVEVA